MPKDDKKILREQSRLPKEKRERRLGRRAAKARERATRTTLKIKPVDLDLEPGEKGFTFRGTKGTRAVVGTASYSRPEKTISVHGIGPDLSNKINKPYVSSAIPDADAAVDSSMVRSLLRQVQKRFPAAQAVQGMRVTGAHAKHSNSGFQRMKLKPQGKLAGLAKAASRGTKALGVAGEAANITEHWRAANVVSQEANKDVPFSTKLSAYAERMLGFDPGTTGRALLPSEVKAAHQL